MVAVAADVALAFEDAFAAVVAAPIEPVVAETAVDNRSTGMGLFDIVASAADSADIGSVDIGFVSCLDSAAVFGFVDKDSFADIDLVDTD